MTECPECNGVGRIVELNPANLEDSTLDMEDGKFEVCAACDGTGRILEIPTSDLRNKR